MIDFLFFSLASFGFAYIVGHSAISLPFRMRIDPNRGNTVRPWHRTRTWFLTLLECPACLGFWQGLLYGALARPAWNPYPWYVLALITCATNLYLAKITGLMDEES